MATVNNSLAKKQQNVGLTAYLTNDAVKKQINSVVGGKDGQRFITAIVSAVQTNPALRNAQTARSCRQLSWENHSSSARALNWLTTT